MCNTNYKIMKRVITYGTFDTFHFGHLEMLLKAKSYGDELYVCLSTDEFNLTKGKTSAFSYKKRKQWLECINIVDVIIPEDSWEQKIKDVKDNNIDVFVIGEDWEGKFDFLKDICEVIYLPRTKDISSSIIKKALDWRLQPYKSDTLIDEKYTPDIVRKLTIKKSVD